MSMRTLFLVPLLASGFLSAPLHAERLLVAGPDGFVMSTDATQDDLAYFTCSCNGPVRAMAHDQRRLYVADDFEQVVVFDLDSGILRNFVWPGIGRIDALAAAGGELFVGSEDGRVARIDPLAGTVLDVRLAPAGVRAMAAIQGSLIVATADGALYRAPLAGGDFTYYTCFCLGSAQDLVRVGDQLFLLDAFGTVVEIDLDTGGILTAFWVGEATSMAAGRGELFFYYDTPGTVARFDPTTGTELAGTITSPIGVNAMLAVPDPRTKVRIGSLPARRP